VLVRLRQPLPLTTPPLGGLPLQAYGGSEGDVFLERLDETEAVLFEKEDNDVSTGRSRSRRKNRRSRRKNRRSRRKNKRSRI